MCIPSDWDSNGNIPAQVQQNPVTRIHSIMDMILERETLVGIQTLWICQKERYVRHKAKNHANTELQLKRTTELRDQSDQKLKEYCDKQDVDEMSEEYTWLVETINDKAVPRAESLLAEWKEYMDAEVEVAGPSDKE